MDITIPITLIIDAAFTGGTIENYAEISASLNLDIVDVNGNSILLPDLDSKPDNLNNEVSVIDNEINQGGSNANQDEDDHDIVTLSINNNCPANWLITENTSFQMLIKVVV